MAIKICPCCETVHTWPTDDDLCEECEREWVDACNEAFGIGSTSTVCED